MKEERKEGHIKQAVQFTYMCNKQTGSTIHVIHNKQAVQCTLCVTNRQYNSRLVSSDFNTALIFACKIVGVVDSERFTVWRWQKPGGFGTKEEKKAKKDKEPKREKKENKSKKEKKEKKSHKEKAEKKADDEEERPAKRKKDKKSKKSKKGTKRDKTLSGSPKGKRAKTSPSSSPHKNMAQELIALGKMFSDGLLTKEEFLKAKADLL